VASVTAGGGVAALGRTREFRRAFTDRVATSLEPTEWGTAIFNTEFPRAYSLNMLRIDQPDERLTAEGLVEEADRVLGGHGLTHRYFEADEAVGSRLAEPLAAAGWNVDRCLVLALRRPPDRQADPGVARAASFDEVRLAKEMWAHSEPRVTSEEVIQQLVDRDRVLSAANEARHFGVFLDEADAVSITELYSDGRMAQVEDVWTREEDRGKGLARASIMAAVEVAVAEKHELILIIADDNDWPKELYGRLGFDPIGRFYEFALDPPVEAG
jgi:GNAT superfamily N-acetyltransferase